MTAVKAPVKTPVRWVRHGARWLLRSASARRWDRELRGDGPYFPNDPGFPSGDREPRRPKPTLPAASMALDVPRENKKFGE